MHHAASKTRPFHRWKSEWRSFQREKAGHRFVGRFDRRAANGKRRSFWKRAAAICAGAVLLAVGLVFAVFPGPAFIFLIPGAALIASESRACARGMDRIDVVIAPLLARLARSWRRLPRAVRLVAIVVASLGGMASLAFGIFSLAH